MLTVDRINEIIELLKNEVKPALGCTEPMAVSLAVAKSCELLRQKGFEPVRVIVEVSANILKNGMGVGIPGVGMVGLHIAAALALTCGKSSYGLEVLKDIDNDAIEKAKALVDEGKIVIDLAKTDLKLYISAQAYSETHSARSIIKDNHDSIVYQEIDGHSIDGELDKLENCSSGTISNSRKSTLDYALDVKTIYEFSKTAPIEKIEFIEESATLNYRLAEEALNGKFGLNVGRTLYSSGHSEIFGSGLMARTMAVTSAACDARMSGCTLPAMSNSGSGNQGITVTLPVVVAAQEFGASREELIRALTLSHLIAIYIKGFLGKLSALCGCVIASTGSACGIVLLKGGTIEQVSYAIQNMIGNITGMVCDGAKLGCALKVASGVSSAVQSAVLALDNISITHNDGIIDDDVEKSIRNLAEIGSKGMQVTDKMILDIMICK